MYKLFLALRYLRKRIIAYFAVAAVMLCVAMLVIVISVMNGFLDKIEQAAKGLFGDVVISSGQQWGIADYDAFIEKIEKLDEVEAASPYIYCYAALRLKPYPNDPYKNAWQDYREGIQAVGIRLPKRAAVSNFENSLLVQHGSDKPSWDPDLDQIIQASLDYEKRTEQLADQTEEQARQLPAGEPHTVKIQRTARELRTASFLQQDLITRLAKLREDDVQKKVRQLEAKLANVLKANNGTPSLDSYAIEDEIDELVDGQPWRGKDQRAILGANLPLLSFRTTEGQWVQRWMPGRKVLIYVLPLAELTGAAPMPKAAELAVVDISKTGVNNIDNATVYLPFDQLQQLNKMTTPLRCSQIHVKVIGSAGDEKTLAAVADKIQAEWNQFAMDNPRDPREGTVKAQTWRQVQSGLIEPIQAQRTLVVVMFAIISIVAVVLIFVIFYMVVLQKTKDIGILKSVGASAPGVAGIFLLYGAIIGLVGAILGTVLGAWFVYNINPIHDWVGQNLGLTVWSKETFMFDEIPNQVDWASLVWILIGSILAGLVGAMIPAIRAATMQPVEALRYE